MCVAADQLDSRYRYLQVFGQQANYGLVRFAIGGNCCCSYPQPLIDGAQDIIATCARLHSNSDEEILASPLGTRINIGCQNVNGVSVLM